MTTATATRAEVAQSLLEAAGWQTTVYRWFPGLTETLIPCAPLTQVVDAQRGFETLTYYYDATQEIEFRHWQCNGDQSMEYGASRHFVKDFIKDHLS